MSREDWSPQTVMVAALSLLLCAFAIAGFVVDKLEVGWVLGVFVGVMQLWSPSPLQIPFVGALRAATKPVEPHITASVPATGYVGGLHDVQWPDQPLDRPTAKADTDPLDDYYADRAAWRREMLQWLQWNRLGVRSIQPGGDPPPPQPPAPPGYRGPASGPAVGWQPLPSFKVDPAAGHFN